MRFRRLPSAGPLIPLLLACLFLFSERATAAVKLGVYQFPIDLASELGQTVPGAMIYWVVPNSSAGQAGLKPGDVITAINEQTIKNFGQLAGSASRLAAGERVKLQFLRAGAPRTAELTLASWSGELTDASYRDALQFLIELRSKHQGPVLEREIVQHHWRLGERRKALARLDQVVARFPDDFSFKLTRIEYLRKSGDFENYAKETLALTERYPRSTAAQLERIEALIALGKLEEAEAAAEGSNDSLLGLFTGEALSNAERLKLWSIIRLRRGASLESRRVSAWTHPALADVRYWRDRLAGQSPYAVDGQKRTEQRIVQSSVLLGLVPQKMHGIAIRINGHEVPLAIVDSGASHTLIATATAKRTGVEIGSSVQQAAGSLSFDSSPGFIRELAIGDIVLRNVPVNVGTPPPLIMTKAEAAIGVDIMHHLRFCIDYPSNRVEVERAKSAAPVSNNAVWDIPLWTFAEHCLSVGTMPDGGHVRTLIDSGNFAHTLVWPAWGKANIANHPGETDSLFVYAFRKPQYELKGLRLGDRTLPTWPVIDMPPVTLQGIDLLDLLMGHDLLAQYKVTIDLLGRRLRLESPTPEFKPPVPPRPAFR